MYLKITFWDAHKMIDKYFIFSSTFLENNSEKGQNDMINHAQKKTNDSKHRKNVQRKKTKSDNNLQKGQNKLQQND